jgi:hypothetical protein
MKWEKYHMTKKKPKKAYSRKGNKMKMSLDKLAKLKSEYEAVVEKEGSRLLKDEFKQFFKDHPEITAVRWQQYTPYFNDGDACLFNVYDFEFSMDPKVEFDSEGSDDRETDDVSDVSKGFLSIYSDQFPKDLKSTCKEFEKHMHGHDEVYEAAFGDHCKVMITPTDITVEAYEHD